MVKLQAFLANEHLYILVVSVMLTYVLLRWFQLSELNLLNAKKKYIILFLLSSISANVPTGYLVKFP